MNKTAKENQRAIKVYKLALAWCAARGEENKKQALQEALRYLEIEKRPRKQTTAAANPMKTQTP